MEITGKIIQKLEPQSGTSKAGNAWKKQEYVLETTDSAYPRKVKFDFFGERADQYVFEVGDVITLSYDIESREFNGRWYTDIRVCPSKLKTALYDNERGRCMVVHLPRSCLLFNQPNVYHEPVRTKLISAVTLTNSVIFNSTARLAIWRR